MASNDPQVFNVCFAALVKKLQNAGTGSKLNVASCMHAIADNYYHFPGCANTLANVAVVLQEANQYHDALHYYNQSLNYFPEAETTFYNMGLCHYHLKYYQKAITQFEESLKISPHYVMAKGWIAHIKENINS